MDKTENEIFIAHIRESDHAVQTVLEHSLAVARLSQAFAFGEFKILAYIAGLYHDVGKYRPLFQRRIRGENIRAEHAICGATIIKKRIAGKENLFGSILLQLVIAGHHTGIPDVGLLSDQDSSTERTLYGRLGTAPSEEEFIAYQDEIELPARNCGPFNEMLTRGLNKTMEKFIVNKFAFFTRYVFSCLTDADSIDTANFCRIEEIDRSISADFRACLEKINLKLASFHPETALQKARSSLQEMVFEKINIDAEIYLLNLPTGSGKTICSMKFALERAIRTDKKRIIYVIPYNSIIDQTVEVFSSIFGESGFVLRHQSTFSYDDDKEIDEDYRKTIQLATENWDAQIIVTTVVQFFESLYGNKRRQLRKLHNMGDSVIVFDEAHMLPTAYLQPCLEGISFITKYINSEAILLSATLPDYRQMFNHFTIGDNTITDLITPDKVKHELELFEKCNYVHIGEVEVDDLMRRASDYPSALIIVNSRQTARKLYENAIGTKFHLSTYMTGLDRMNTILKVKQTIEAQREKYSDLSQVPADERIVVISTSLIEAGVDLDFFVVFRELMGLDNILQSGGRCNREGKRAKGDVFIFQLIDPDSNQKPVSHDGGKANITKGILESGISISTPEAVAEYYHRIFFMEEQDIVKNSLYEWRKGVKIDTIPFRTYTEEFRLIKDNSYSIVVGIDEESEELIRQIQTQKRCNMRKLQKYTCSVKKWEFDDLMGQNVINHFGTSIWVLTNTDYYDRKIGIKFEASDYFIT